MRYVLTIALAAALAGCGSAPKRATPSPSAHAAELVNYQRNGGLAATLDTVTVRTDGTRLGATYLLRYRGRTYVGREGAVPAALRPAVATLQAIVEGGGRGGPVHRVTQAPA